MTRQKVFLTCVLLVGATTGTDAADATGSTSSTAQCVADDAESCARRADTTSDPLPAHWTAFPYPPRLPTAGVPENIRDGSLRLFNHYLWGGNRSWSQGPLRVLVAGAGTGDATLAFAAQIAQANNGAGLPDAHVTHFEISAASIEVARQRVEHFGLQRYVTFVEGDLNDVARLTKFERFDIINCVGVLHHLAEPLTVLQSLTSSLRDDGGMFLMVYGTYGRNGVREVSDAVDILAPRIQPDRTPEEVFQDRLATVRLVLRELPDVHWLRLNNNLLGGLWEQLAAEANASIPTGPEYTPALDSVLYDTFLVERQEPLTITELAMMLKAAGLEAISFDMPPLHLRLSNSSLRSRAGLGHKFQWHRTRGRDRRLTAIQEAALVESMIGRLTKHQVIVRRADLPASAPSHSTREQRAQLLPTSVICRTASHSGNSAEGNGTLTLNVSRSSRVMTEHVAAGGGAVPCRITVFMHCGIEHRSCVPEIIFETQPCTPCNSLIISTHVAVAHMKLCMNTYIVYII